MSTAAQTAGVIANAAQNAGQMETANQQAAAAGQPQASAFDVMSHTASGIGGMRDGSDQGLQSTMAGGVHRSTLNDTLIARDQGFDAIKQAAAQISEAKGALPTFGAIMGTLQSMEQLISMPFSAIPFPAFPAVRIMDMDIGLPHAHAHPPNLIPPAPPIPLPSTGPIIPIPFVSGANKTLINCMPAARCGDIGLGIWCGGYFPLYEVFLGSCNVWIEGNRAARLAIDITKHCIFSSPKPSDPPMGPMIGMTITSSANVLIGGFPLPSLLSMAMGAALKALFKGVGKVLSAVRKRLAKGKPNALAEACSAGEPINVVTGANFNSITDFFVAGSIPIHWRRHYSSDQHQSESCVGHGFRHEYQRALYLMDLGFEYIDQKGHTTGFAPFEVGASSTSNRGLTLKQITDSTFEIRETGQPVLEFKLVPGTRLARLSTVRQNKLAIQLAYNSLGQLSKLTQIDMPELRLSYSKTGMLEKVTQVDASGRESLLITYQYDHRDNLVLARNALGATNRYSYDDRNQLTRCANPLGYGFNYEYDSVGRCIRTCGDDGLYDCAMAYFPLELRSVATYADGAKVEYRYDARGTLTYVSNVGGVAKTFNTDENGQVLEEVDENGNVWTWLYDQMGGNIGRRDPLGNVWDRLDRQPNPPDPLQPKLPQTSLEWEYGELLRVSNTVLASPVIEPMIKDCPAPVYNHLITMRSRIERQIPVVEKNVLGNVFRQIDLEGNSIEFTNDIAGNITEIKDRCGAITKRRIGSWNMLQETIGPSGEHIKYEYSLRQYITKITDAGESESHYIYDHADRIVEVRRHGRTREAYKYDGAGNLVARYGSDGRLLASWVPGPGNLALECHTAEGDVHRFQYDKSGKVTQAIWDDGKQSVQISYDVLGQRTLEMRGNKGISHQLNGGVLETKYFEKFVVASRQTPDGLTITDPKGQVHIFRFAQMGLARKQLANGTQEISQYDWRGRCKTKVRWYEEASIQVPWITTYHYSPEDELLAADDSKNGSTRYEYDASHRVIAVIHPNGRKQSIVRDVAGNLLEKAGLSGVVLQTGNRLAEANGSRFAYNDRNHIEFVEDVAYQTQYQYDSLDRLIGIRNAKIDWQASYDPLCRRIAKTVNGQTTEFYWDGDRLAAEVSHSGRLRLYIYVDRSSWVPFMFIEYETMDADPSTGVPYYIFTDQIGTPIKIEDGSRQEVWRAEYEPYGKCELSTKNRVRLDLRFPGHYADTETGLHFNRRRYYSPTLGRYVASDPIGVAGGINLYAYAPNPLVQVDLIGLAHDVQPANTGANGVEGTGGKPIFRGGDNLEPRLGVDVKPAKDGLIHPLGSNGKAQGLSLNLNPKDQFIQKYGGAYPVTSIPEGLQVVQSGKPGHYVVAPAKPMPFDQYKQLCSQVQLGNANAITP